MAARRPSFAIAAIELGFIAASFAAGWASGAWPMFAGVAGLAIGYWAWTRRNALASMNILQRVVQGGLGVAMLLVVLGGAFALGLAIRGDPNS